MNHVRQAKCACPSNTARGFKEFKTKLVDSTDRQSQFSR